MLFKPLYVCGDLLQQHRKLLQGAKMGFYEDSPERRVS